MHTGATIRPVNNPTQADHNNATVPNRGAEAFLYIFIFGGMFIALVGGAIGIHFILKYNPNLLSDISETLQEEETRPKTTTNYNYNSSKNMEPKDRTETNTKTEVKTYINNSPTPNNPSGEPSNNTYQQTNPAPSYTPPAPTCYKYEIFSGELKSKRCYTYEDYRLITNYYNKYQSADWSYDSANSSIKFLCDGNDFFEDSCEDAKDRKNDAAKDKEEYLELGLAVIARGTPVN